jgi:hypothetical protein
MSNVKISQLPLYTGNTSGAYLVMDDASQTSTYKVTRENLIGSGTNINGSFYSTGSYNINSSSLTVLNLDSTNYANGISVISGSMIVIPSTGQYLINSTYQWKPGGSLSNFCNTSLRLNGSTIISSRVGRTLSGFNVTFNNNFSRTFNSNDKLELVVNTDASTSSFVYTTGSTYVAPIPSVEVNITKIS